MWLYRILLGIDGIVAVVFLFFFADGLADGTVSSFNAVLWFAILAGLGVVIGGGFALRSSGNRVAANVLLAILAVPAMGFGLLMGLLIVSGTRFN